MDTGQALIDAIESDPDDDVARLAYADYLDEREGEETPRAALIRAQVELSRLPPKPFRVGYDGSRVVVVRYGAGCYSFTDSIRGGPQVGDRVDVRALRLNGKKITLPGMRVTRITPASELTSMADFYVERDAQSGKWPGWELDAIVRKHARAVIDEVLPVGDLLNEELAYWDRGFPVVAATGYIHWYRGDRPTARASSLLTTVPGVEIDPLGHFTRGMGVAFHDYPNVWVSPIAVNGTEYRTVYVPCGVLRGLKNHDRLHADLVTCVLYDDINKGRTEVRRALTRWVRNHPR